MLANDTCAPAVAPGPTIPPLTSSTATPITAPPTAPISSCTTTNSTTTMANSVANLSETPTSLPTTPTLAPFPPSIAPTIISKIATTTTGPAAVAGASMTQISASISAKSTHNDNDDLKIDNIGPNVKRPKARPTPISRPILLSADRRNRKKKSISWQSEEKLQRVHYFELIANERVNVSLNSQSNIAVDGSAAPSGQPLGTSPNAHANRLNQNSLPANANAEASARSHDGLERREWRLILIDYNNELPGPGWNSIERSAQAERENYVLGAIDLPGQPSILDEPDGNESTSTTAMKNEQGVKIIPLENPDGMYSSYPDLSSSEIVNGVRVPLAGSQPLGQNVDSSFNTGQQTSQLFQNSAQPPQLMNSVNQSPFSFQEMSAQFQAQSQLQQQQQQTFPFLQQQQFHLTPPFAAQSMQPNQPAQFMAAQHQQQQQQNQQQSQGPIMPWLNYPFSQVNENSHLQLYRRPAT